MTTSPLGGARLSVGPGVPEFIRHARKIGCRRQPHLAHQVFTTDLHRIERDASKKALKRVTNVLIMVDDQDGWLCLCHGRLRAVGATAGARRTCSAHLPATNTKGLLRYSPTRIAAFCSVNHSCAHGYGG
jgi:hypothetical protein